jgi:hypothetical protein
MSKSTLIKLGVLAVATLAAQRTYSALCRNKAEGKDSRGSSRAAGSTAKPAAATNVGRPADAFSTNAVQRDLSIGDAV